MQELKLRLRKLNPLGEKLDGILLINRDQQSDPNFTYMTGADCVTGFFFYDFSKARIFTNKRDYPLAKRSMVKGVRIAKKGMLEALVRKKTVGIDKTSLTVATYEQLKKAKPSLVDISAHLVNARAQKTRYEIRCIRAACKKSGILLGRVENKWKGTTEIEFKGMVEYEMHRLGVTPAFPTIVASGSSIAVPHHAPAWKKIRIPFLIDFGVRYKNYVSDVTRTFGSRYENALQRILDDLYPKIIPGVRAKDLNAFVRKALGRHEKHFITALGHGIGVAVHEAPNLRQASEDVLKENMVFTIEPGVYVPGGLRIENDFLLKKDGVECLTEF